MEFNKRYTMEAAKGTISDAGVKALLIFLRSQNLQADEWKVLNPDNIAVLLPFLPEDWQWLWVVTKGEYRGTMPKRVSSYFHKQHNIKCPNTFLQEIGNIARAHSESGVTYRYEFVNKIDWERGDFGDSTSCYWTTNEGAKDMIQEHGALAIRFYDENDKGLARAWLYEIGDSLWVLWNGYGFEHATLNIARVVAQHFGLTYKKITLENQGRDGGELYINGGQGYLIGVDSVLETMRSYDFEWDYGCPDTCHSCGQCVNEYEGYTGADDLSYCEDCYYEIFDTCERCGETHYRDDLYYTHDEMLCEYCLDKRYVQCDKCGEFERREDARIKDDRTLCESCREGDIEEVDDE